MTYQPLIIARHHITELVLPFTLGVDNRKHALALGQRVLVHHMAAASPLKGLGALDGSGHVRVPVGAGLVLCVQGADAALGDHGLDVLGVERLLEQVHDIKLDRIEHDVASQEQLIGLTEAKLLERAHQLLVGLPALAHCETVGGVVVDWGTLKMCVWWSSRRMDGQIDLGNRWKSEVVVWAVK